MPGQSPLVGDGDNGLLERVVDEHVGPRLSSLHSHWRVPAFSCEPDADVIENFARLVILPNGAQAANFFFRKRDDGMGMALLLEKLLAPTARRLGDFWFEDQIDFVDVTLGVTRLRALLGTCVRCGSGPDAPRRSALLISAPKERHFFGVDVVSAFLVSSGWDTVVSLGRSASDNARAAQLRSFCVLGVTVSEEAHLEDAARMIEMVRKRSANPSISVMVGGQALRGRPDLAARIGGDAMAEDGPGALLLANRFYFDQLTAG
ncbi:cobalamin-dependent protein [uncultured Rhodoblastus sp.]|uniref:cobalamin B12-binding domain-containing protein n=1 Tax=uncultured Rhodoblastus sp. TaxID=543037 RepID=UPI0025EE8222|nr:cobalamin-dependent protein [uncultured Rhodoblastus sp.]